jgi:hypothetical protein
VPATTAMMVARATAVFLIRRMMLPNEPGSVRPKQEQRLAA